MPHLLTTCNGLRHYTRVPPVPEDSVRLEREPTNEYDPNAIKVHVARRWCTMEFAHDWDVWHGVYA